MDKILIRMPSDFDYLLPAMAVTHAYMGQKEFAMLQRYTRIPDYQIFVELGDESHFFFSPLFPRADLLLRTDEKCYRKDWDAVLDMRDMEKGLALAKPTNKHITEIWGILLGAPAKLVPILAYFGARIKQDTLDILIDREVDQDGELEYFFSVNYPEVKVRTEKVNGQRIAGVFDRLCETKMYVGKRSGATYLAATMGKALVEFYPDDKPLWWLQKPLGEKYKVIYSKECTPKILWVFVEELWISLYETKCPEGIRMVPQASTVERVSVR